MSIFKRNYLVLASSLFFLSTALGHSHVQSIEDIAKRQDKLEHELKELKKQDIKKSRSEKTEKNPLLGVSSTVEQGIYQSARNYLKGITVTTSPILGMRSAWNASDLLYQIPSMNQDLLLLERRQQFQNYLKKLGSSLNLRPILVVSGGVLSTLIYTKNYTNSDDLDANVSAARFELWPILSAWANGFISMDFDNSPPQTGSRVTNSRIYISRAYLTIGNLDVSPLYATFGQMYVPFGRYASAMQTAPLTLSLGRIEARAILLGIYKKGFYLEGFGYNGDRVISGNHVVFQGGANVGYKNKYQNIGSLDVGAGYVTNLTDSQGMQNNGLSPGPGVPSTQFGGFAKTTNVNRISANDIKHNVDAIDVHVEATKGYFAFLAEYIRATRRYDAGDLLFGNNGAQPAAMHLELDFNYKFGHTPITVGTAYGRSWDALPLNLPQQSIFAVFITSLWKNTAQGIEYRHDTNYNVTPNTGGGGNGNRANIIPVPNANVGGSQDLVTLFCGVYF